jgi:hypothetical protein
MITEVEGNIWIRGRKGGDRIHSIVISFTIDTVQQILFRSSGVGR